MNNPGLIKSFVCGAAIAPHRIVMFGANDNSMVQATAATDLLVGVSDELGGNNGGRVDIILSGVAEVEYGGAVTRGAKLTTDANGKAVATAPVAGVNAHVIAIAMVSGVLGDIGSALIVPSVMQG